MVRIGVQGGARNEIVIWTLTGAERCRAEAEVCLRSSRGDRQVRDRYGWKWHPVHIVDQVTLDDLSIFWYGFL